VVDAGKVMVNLIQEPIELWFFGFVLVFSLLIAIDPRKRILQFLFAREGKPVPEGHVALLRLFSTLIAIALGIMVVWYLVGPH
jgi:hypothetical protein